MKIGKVLREFRARERLTLNDLAQRTGLTTSFLSQVERDLASPSVSSLEKVAEALNTKVSCLFEGMETRGLIFIKKGSHKIPVVEKNKIICESLAPNFLNIKMQPHIFTLGAGAELQKELVYPEGEKFGMILNGRIEFICQDEKFIFRTGDSFYCAYAQKVRKAINIGKKEAKLFWIIFALT
ncbi:MAG: XRE family transcriptional regulator [bacterium]